MKVSNALRFHFDVRARGCVVRTLLLPAPGTTASPAGGINP
jgi:hypothetical protein